MSRPFRSMLLTAAASLLASGCVSTLQSQRATETAKGVRYALPIPVLQVTPKPDGTMGVEVLYLPDPNNTYVVTASSFLGAYTLDVKTKDGLLDTVSFSQDGTAMAQAGIEAYADIRKAKVEAQAKADEAAAAKAEETAKAAVAEAKALSEAKTALNVAEAKRDKLKALSAGADALIAAELAVVEAQTKLTDLQAATAAKATFVANNTALNAAGTKENGAFPTANGPIFYRMGPAADGGAGVDLYADDVQVTGFTAKPVKPTPKVPPVAYQPFGVPVVTPSKYGLVLRLRVNQAVHAPLTADAKLTPDGPGVRVWPIAVTKAVENTDTYFYVLLDDRQAGGDYSLSLPVQVDADGNDEQRPATVRFRIRK